jgi:hypothetical protein
LRQFGILGALAGEQDHSRDALLHGSLWAHEFRRVESR